MKEGFKNWMLVFSIVIMSGVIFFLIFPKKEIDEESDVLGRTAVDYRYIPYITSISPVAVQVNETFRYEVKISDLDTPDEDIDIYLIGNPSWMYLESNIVLGIPNEEGTYKFTISVSDGVNSTSQVNYVLVEGNE